MGHALYHKGQELIPKSYRNEELMPLNSYHLFRGLVCRDLTQFGVFHTFSSLLVFCHSHISAHFSLFSVDAECREEK